MNGSSVNNVPMQGNGSYRSHSALQHEAMLKALPLLKNAIHEARTTEQSTLTVIEYGSAHGNNSIEPLELILQSYGPGDRTVQLLLTDRPENDFKTLSATITAWTDSLEQTNVFVGMIPQNFYCPVVPAQSVQLGFSLACLHHLQQLPETLFVDNDPERQRELLRTQAHADLCKFLSLRAVETISAGSLVLSLVGEASSGRVNYAGPVDACRQAMKDMLDEGRLSSNAVGAFYVPTYNRTLEDVRRALDEVSSEWEVRELSEDGVLHPAIAELEQSKEHRASEWYAEIVVDWLMAVVSGYFLKALRVGGTNSEEEAKGLLGEWVGRTKRLFLQNHRDEEVFCCFIYVRLQRL